MPRRPSEPGSTFVARTLRRLREESGLSAAAVAEEVNRRARRDEKGLTQYTLSRYESGKTAPPEAAVRELAALYGVDTETLAVMLGETREARQHDSRVVLHRPYEHHFQAQVNDAENRAVAIRALATQTLVPGLTQTDGYAAVLAGQLEGDDKARWLANRANTRAAIGNPNRAVEIVMTDGPLRYPLAPAEVMAEQMGRLIEVSRLAHVSLGVVTARHVRGGIGRPVMSDCTLYRFGDGRRVIYGTQDGTAIVDDDARLNAHEEVLDLVRGHAVWDDDARAVLIQMRRSYS